MLFVTISVKRVCFVAVRLQPCRSIHRAAEDVLTGVVHTGLDDVVQGEATGCLLVTQASIHLGRKHLGHVVVVLAQVGVLLLRGVVHLQLVVGVSKRHDDVGLLAYRAAIKKDRSEESLATISFQELLKQPKTTYW